jgi:glutathionylspermidine synthase
VRALIEDPAQIAPGRYRRFVRRAQLEAMLADHLFEGEPYLALNAAVLDHAEAALLQELSETFATAFDTAARAIAADVPLLEEIGFPWSAAELLAAETPHLPLLGRFDFLRDEHGHWWLLEFNADTPSGVREAIVVDEIVHGLLPNAQRLTRPNDVLAEMLTEGFQKAMRGLQPGTSLGLLTDAGELEDLAQMAFTQSLLAEPLAEQGIKVLLGDADNLGTTRLGVTLLGKRIAALYRYLPLESLFGTAAFVAIYDGVARGRLRLLNGLYGLLLQHKGLLATLWETRASTRFSRAERAAIQAHLAPTWRIGCSPPGLPAAELVVKQVFGREGEEVFFGEDCSSDMWAELQRRRTYVVQQRIHGQPLDAAMPTSSGFQRWRGYLTAGVYVVDGRAAGFYTRFGGKIITARSKWLATFVEPGQVR